MLHLQSLVPLLYHEKVYRSSGVLSMGKKYADNVMDKFQYKAKVEERKKAVAFRRKKGRK